MIKKWFIRHFTTVYCLDCTHCSVNENSNNAKCLASPKKKKKEYLSSDLDCKIMKEEQKYYYCSIERCGKHCGKYNPIYR